MFGHERPARKARPSVEPSRVGKEAAAPGKWKSHEQVLEEMLEAELDPSRRPRQKVNPSWARVNTAELGALPSGSGCYCSHLLGVHEASLTFLESVGMMTSGLASVPML